MSGVAVVRQLLVSVPNLFSAVPAVRVIAGVVPQGTALPCVAITEISSSDRTNVRGYRVRQFTQQQWWGDTPTTRTTSLVQLTVLANTYPELKSVMKQLRTALRDFTGDVGPFFGCTCRLEHQGPDFESEEEIVMQTQDVRVTFHESIQ